MNINEKQNFISLKDFPLSWRWTNPKFNLLPQEILLKIKPFNEIVSKKIWKRSTEFAGDDTSFKPNHLLFEAPDKIETYSKDETDIIEWLSTRIPTTKIIVSWQPNTAVFTDTEVFIQYWDDFCYPSSDDVSIWPIDEKWILHYWHEERFYYSKRKS